MIFMSGHNSPVKADTEVQFGMWHSRGVLLCYVILVTYATLPWIGLVASYADIRMILLGAFLIIGCIPFAAALKPRLDIASRDRFFEILTVSVSFFLLMVQTVVSNYLLGYDVHQEFYDFLETSLNGWNPAFGGWYNSVLSVTILPSILHAVSAIDGI